MKYYFTFIITLLMGAGTLTAQTRYFSAGYSNLPLEMTGSSETVLYGRHGVMLGTHKFKSNKIMRGFVLLYQQLGSTVEGEQYIYDANTGFSMYVPTTTEISVKKYSIGYESIRLFGQKEWDDPGAFYGAFGYYLSYSQTKETFTSSDPSIEADEYAPDLYYAPIDMALKLGVGYQHMIGKQWMVYAEGKAYLSILANVGYEYGIGVRYRALGAK